MFTTIGINNFTSMQIYFSTYELSFLYSIHIIPVYSYFLFLIYYLFQIFRSQVGTARTTSCGAPCRNHAYIGSSRESSSVFPAADI